MPVGISQAYLRDPARTVSPAPVIDQATACPGVARCSEARLNGGLITKDDQLDDLFPVNRKIECEDERIWQTSLIIVAVHIGGDDDMPIVLHDVDDIHCDAIADDVAGGSSPDCPLTPVLA